MISLLIWILIICLVFGLIVWVMQQFPIPQPFYNIAMALVGVIMILILVSVLMGEIPIRGLR